MSCDEQGRLRYVFGVLVAKSEENNPLTRWRIRMKDIIKKDLKGTEGVERIDLAHGTQK